MCEVYFPLYTAKILLYDSKIIFKAQNEHILSKSKFSGIINFHGSNTSYSDQNKRK